MLNCTAAEPCFALGLTGDEMGYVLPICDWRLSCLGTDEECLEDHNKGAMTYPDSMSGRFRCRMRRILGGVADTGPIRIAAILDAIEQARRATRLSRTWRAIAGTWRTSTVRRLQTASSTRASTARSPTTTTNITRRRTYVAVGLCTAWTALTITNTPRLFSWMRHTGSHERPAERRCVWHRDSLLIAMNAAQRMLTCLDGLAFYVLLYQAGTAHRTT